MIYVNSNATKVIITHEKPKYSPFKTPFYNIIYDLTIFFKDNSCNYNDWYSLLYYSHIS